MHARQRCNFSCGNLFALSCVCRESSLVVVFSQSRICRAASGCGCLRGQVCVCLKGFHSAVSALWPKSHTFPTRAAIPCARALPAAAAMGKITVTVRPDGLHPLQAAKAYTLHEDGMSHLHALEDHCSLIPCFPSLLSDMFLTHCRACQAMTTSAWK